VHIFDIPCNTVTLPSGCYCHTPIWLLLSHSHLVVTVTLPSGC